MGCMIFMKWNQTPFQCFKAFAKGYILVHTEDREAKEAKREIGDCRYDLSAIFLKLIVKGTPPHGDCEQRAASQEGSKMQNREDPFSLFSAFISTHRAKGNEARALAPFGLRKISLRMKNSTLSFNNKKNGNYTRFFSAIEVSSRI